MRTVSTNGVEEHLESMLNLPRQIWLLGAGISRDAGVPLMYPLTDRVANLLADKKKPLDGLNTNTSATIYSALRGMLSETSHVEQVLSQIGDYISIASRQKDTSVLIDGQSVTAESLNETHHHIQLAIRYTVEHGYIPPDGAKKEKIGRPGASIVQRDFHDEFVRSLFHVRRAGLEQNPPVIFFTTNYDTLLEDALAFHRIAYVDGFSGGGTGFWDVRNSNRRLEHDSRFNRHSARVAKLHGSIDWVSDDSGVVMRVRSSNVGVSGTQRLLIYPQATKYQVTQRDPFASLFSQFRQELNSSSPTVLIICGYSFGDDHINEEIERCLRTGPPNLNLLAFCHQVTDEKNKLTDNEGLPLVVAQWLKKPEYASRVIVAGSRGYYRGNLTNTLDATREYHWWTFSGLTKMLANGVEIES